MTAFEVDPGAIRSRSDCLIITNRMIAHTDGLCPWVHLLDDAISRKPDPRLKRPAAAWGPPARLPCPPLVGPT